MMQSSCSRYQCQSPLLIWCVIVITVYKLGREFVKALAQNKQHVAGYAGFPEIVFSCNNKPLNRPIYNNFN